MKTVRLLFNDDMARAIVEGRKTVTRRPVMPFRIGDGVDVARIDGRTAYLGNEDDGDIFVMPLPCAPGDILIGRECWGKVCSVADPQCFCEDDEHHTFVYRADTGDEVPGGWTRKLADEYGVKNRWKPSMHMPDAAARIRRRVVSVTVERLQDITEDDAVREGFGTSEELEEFFRNCAPPGSRMARPRDSFEAAWDSIYAAKGLGWGVNPWAWRIEFASENVQEASNGR